MLQRTGNFAWVFWVAVLMNVFTNLMTAGFYYFTKIANKKFTAIPDPATGEKLSEKNKKFEFRKVLEMPWTFWAVLLYSLVQTSASVVFSQNATELAEHRFQTDAATAVWYSALAQYAGKPHNLCIISGNLLQPGFFVTPFLGVFIDVFGNRISARE
jgi:hypothetical protein